MKEKLDFVRLPIILFVVFFIARLAAGAANGVSKETYDGVNKAFSMVILQIHVGLLWGAVARRYRGFGIGATMMCIALAVLASQILILIGTAGSYLAGVETFFNFPEALNQSEPVAFGTAMVARTITLVANSIIGAIVGAIGWLLGGLIPRSEKA